MLKKIQTIIKAVFSQEYAKASIYYVIANIIGQGVVLLSSAIFTRLMSKSDFGLVSTYSTWVLVINTFICLNLFISVRIGYVDFRDDYDNYNSSVLLLNILCGVVMTLIIIAVTALFSGAFGFWEVLFACVQSVSLNIVNYMLAIQGMKNEYAPRSAMMVLPNWTHITLSVILILVFFNSAYMAKIAGNSIGLLIFGVICTVLIFKKSAPKIIPKYWKYALKVSVPSIFHTLSDLILMQCDRLMLTSMVGTEETAEYSVIYNVSSIIVAIYQAINGAWLPWFFTRVKENNAEKTRKYQGYYMLAFTVFSCGMMTISPELIKIISPSNYWDGLHYVAPIVIASYLIFLYAFLSSYLLYLKRTARIAVNTVIAAALNLVLNYLLIPDYKAVGAVIATVASYSVLYVLHFIAVSKEDRRFFCVSKMWLNAFAVAAYGFVFFFISDYWFIRYLLFAISAGLVYYLKGRAIIADIMKRKKD